MMTMQDYEQMFSKDAKNMRLMVRAYKNDVNTLKKLHHDARMTHNNPKTVVKQFVSEVGYENAVSIIASIVNARALWDGRISTINAEWAKENAVWDRDVIIRMGCYADDVIHSVHLNQLCDYMRRKEV